MAFNIDNDTNALLRNKAFHAPTVSNTAQNYVNQYMPSIKLEEDASLAQNALERVQMGRAFDDQDQSLIANQTGRGIEMSPLAEYQRQALDTQQFAELSDKDRADVLKSEFGRKQKINDLTQQFVSQQLQSVNHEFNQNMQRFQNAFSQYRQTAEGKFGKEAVAVQDRLQKQFDDAAMKIQSRMKRSSIGQRIATGVGGLVGAGLGMFAGNPLLGMSLGSGLASGVGGLIGNERSSNDVYNYLDNMGSQSF